MTEADTKARVHDFTLKLEHNHLFYGDYNMVIKTQRNHDFIQQREGIPVCETRNASTFDLLKDDVAKQRQQRLYEWCLPRFKGLWCIIKNKEAPIAEAEHDELISGPYPPLLHSVHADRRAQ